MEEEFHLWSLLFPFVFQIDLSSVIHLTIRRKDYSKSIILFVLKAVLTFHVSCAPSPVPRGTIQGSIKGLTFGMTK